MTTYNTGNALGSVDVKDLYDNAENLDVAVNSLESTWVDRLGVTRTTLQGVTLDAATLTQLASGEGASLIGFTPEGETAITVESAIQSLQDEVGSFAGEIDGKANDDAVVKLTLDQTIAGVKTFSSSPVVPNATTATQAVAFGQITGKGITTATAVTASGTAVDFTSIPSWAKRITVMLSNVSTNGTANLLLQLGDAGGIEDTGYSGATYRGGEAGTAVAALSSGVLVNTLVVAANLYNANITLSKIEGNNWSFSGLSGATGTSTNGCWTIGSKTLSDTLTQVRITTVGVTNTFDAGTINISYEG